MAKVHLMPEIFYFPAGGASVQHVAAAGDMTFARLTRLNGRYRMHVLSGEFCEFDPETTDRLSRASTYEWPHAFSRFDATPEEFLGRFGANHIHAVPGDRVAELRAVCTFLDIDFDGFGPLA
jgi:L-fucose isomerase